MNRLSSFALALDVNNAKTKPLNGRNFMGNFPMDFLKNYMKLWGNQVCIGVGVTRATAMPKAFLNVSGRQLLLDECGSPPGAFDLGEVSDKPSQLSSRERRIILIIALNK